MFIGTKPNFNANCEHDQLQLDISLLQHRPSFSWHYGAFLRYILALEIIRHLLEGNPFHTFMLVDMVNDPSPH